MQKKTMLTADQRAELQEIKRSSQNKMNVMWTPPLRAFVLNLVKEHRLLLGERKMEGYQRLANELDLRGEQAKSAIVGPSLSKKVRRMIQEVEGLEVPILPWHLTAKALSKQIWGFESVNETQRDMKAAAPQELDAIESDLLLHQAQPLQKQQEPPPSSNAHLFVERQGPSHTNDDDDDDDENDNKPMEYKPSTLGKRPREPIEKSSSSDVSENSDEESTASSDFEDVTPIFEVSRSSRLQRGFVPSSSAPVQTLASSRHGPVNKLSTAKKPRRDITLQSISLSDADEELVTIMKDAAGKLKESDSSLQGVISFQASMIENLQRMVDKKEKQFCQLQAVIARYFTSLQQPIPQDLMKPLFPPERLETSTST